MNTIEVDEQEYLALIEKNAKLQKKVDKLETCLFGMMKQVDELLKDEGDE